MPNLFAKYSKKQPLAKPIEQDIPNPFQQRLRAFRRRCSMGRILHNAGGPYRKPREDEK